MQRVEHHARLAPAIAAVPVVVRAILGPRSNRRRVLRPDSVDEFAARWPSTQVNGWLAVPS